VSLADFDAYAFAVFRETGVLAFTIPLRTLDEILPGTYLRLIKRVRTSVVALIPPTLGIRASLTADGTSRAVVGGDVFQETTIRRDPETVFLTSPINATGVFELDEQSELLGPFEAMGLATRWEFRMPKASNPFDFRTIADVQVAFDYTALFSDDYRRQVIKGLDPHLSAEKAHSIRDDDPDAWYDLANPHDGTQPAQIRFRTEGTDFPPNLDDVKVQEVVFAVLSGRDGAPMEGDIILSYAADGQSGSPVVLGTAGLQDQRISTRLASGRPWGSIRGQQATGTWQFTLPAELAAQFSKGTIEDVLIVVTFSGTKPDWPS
jgi:hypothetical protein